MKNAYFKMISNFFWENRSVADSGVKKVELCDQN